MLAKIKDWLIHKLGGCTAKDPVPYKIEHITKPIQKLSVSFQHSQLFSLADDDERIKTFLATQISKKLLEEGYIRFTYQTEEFPPVNTIRADLWVVTPE